MFEHRTIRTLTCYSLENERIVFDVQIKGFSLKKFQIEFGVDASDKMYDCYQVTVKNLPFIKDYLPSVVGINWDFKNYEYYIEAVQN